MFAPKPIFFFGRLGDFCVKNSGITDIHICRSNARTRPCVDAVWIPPGRASWFAREGFEVEPLQVGEFDLNVKLAICQNLSLLFASEIGCCIEIFRKSLAVEEAALYRLAVFGCVCIGRELQNKPTQTLPVPLQSTHGPERDSLGA